MQQRLRKDNVPHVSWARGRFSLTGPSQYGIDTTPTQRQQADSAHRNPLWLLRWRKREHYEINICNLLAHIGRGAEADST